MSDGQVAMNTNLASPGLFFKDSNGDLVKVGPVHVGTTAPNATPASGGQAGNSKGEQWLDTSSSRYVFKIWDGTAWRTEDGEFVNTSGDTMTGALGIIAGTAAAPGVFFTGDPNTGIYSPGADQLAISTNAVERVEFGTGEVVFNNGGANYDFRIEGDTNSSLFFVDASAEAVGIGTTSPGARLDVNADGGTALPTISAGTAGIVSRTAGTANFCGFSLIAGTASTSSLNFGDADDEDVGNIQYIHSDNAMRFITAASERARIDSSGRLLVGTSTTTALNTVLLQGNSTSSVGASFIKLARGTSAPGSNDALGSVEFSDNGHTNAAVIRCDRDGGTWTSGSSQPARLVFSTTADGASTPTEVLRLTNDNVIAYNQAAPATVNTSATITAANLKTGIITSTTAAAVTMTLPTGTNIELGFSSIYTNMTFEFSVINTGPNTLTVGANGNTTVGSLTVATLTSARYALRRTGANAFTLYRLS
jgi:hypothetical protein